ncbi:MAG: hypothetical protein CUN54_01170, partial [Phototrophicales bacterium]
GWWATRRLRCFMRDASHFVALKRDLPMPQLPQLPPQKHVSHQGENIWRRDARYLTACLNWHLTTHQCGRTIPLN